MLTLTAPDTTDDDTALPVRPLLTVGCPGCGDWFDVPSTAVGQVVGCERCRRRLHVVLDIRETDCENCGAPLPAGQSITCSARCKSAVAAARRRARERARR